jgi:hypothetical protein
MAAQVRAVIFTKDYIPPHTQLTWTYNTCTADGGDDLLDGNDVDSSQTSSASQDERAGGDLGAAILASLNTAAISWVGGNQIAWTSTSYDAQTQSIRFRYATAAAFPAAAPELFIDSVYQDPNTGIAYDRSRVLGTLGADVGSAGHVVYTDGAFKLPYVTTQGGGAGVAVLG